ncbi:MAG TPA: ABC transporter ATP-binding protein [Clostridiaceae bacterium]|nr:ABC transporter ATP-binding protein [Clostridiaceae bacterium]
MPESFLKGRQALYIKDLSYEINEKKILHDINLKINAGEFVGFIGPNGAGKTTLLKCINRINKYKKGQIEINDQNIENIKDREIAREVSIMHQNTNISFPFPSIDVVLMGRYPYKRRFEPDTKEDYEIAKRNMEYTNTIKFEHSPITDISGGERQRILFSKVLTQDTDLILLDEPTASLDINHQEQIFRYTRELCDSGRTAIVAIHELNIAAKYCSRLVLLKDGRILADGTPEEVMTAENLSKAYGVNALVYRNRITGQLDFYIYGLTRNKVKKRVHVIGGGGSASGLIRYLFVKGYKITGGVFAHGDSDLQCAEVYGIDYVVCKPFSEIGKEAFDENVEMIKKADFTVLCNMPFGMLNIKNLEAAKNAENLIIIEDDPPESRDYTGGKALADYYSLKKNSIVTTSARLHEIL